MKDLEKEKKLAVKEYVKMKNEEDTPTQLKKKNSIMKRSLKKLAGYVNQMAIEHESEEVFDELMVLANHIKITLKKEGEV